MFWKEIRFFKPSEFDTRDSKGNKVSGSGEQHMKESFVRRLDRFRYILDKPRSISSGYRSPERNKQVSGTGESGPHTTGRASDIPCGFADAHATLHAACLVAVVESGYLSEEKARECLQSIVRLNLGFTGIGLNQKGDANKRYIHLDDLPKNQAPRPSIWTY